MEEEILKIFNKISYIYSLIITMGTSIFGGERLLFLGYLILNILDYITGTIKSRINRVENSNKGIVGIIKKICYWILICIAFLISFLISQIGIKININLNFIMLFGWFTLVCLIINETRSIIENLLEIGIKVPGFLIKGLDIYEKIIEKTLDNSIEEKRKDD